MTRRVLFMISSMRGGGSEQQTLLLLRHLDRTRFAPHLFVLQRDGELMPSVPDDVVVHCYQEQRPPAGIYFPGRVLRRQVRYLRELLHRQSIDVIYDRTFHMTMIAGDSAHRVGVPRVSTIVSPPDQALPSVESRFVYWKRRRLARAYRRSRAVVAVSQIAADSATHYYSLASDRVQVIHNPVDIDRVRAAAQQAKVVRDQRLTLVCVGRMSKEKGQRDLIDALALVRTSWTSWPAEVPAIRLWMIGDGAMRAELQDQANRQGLGHSIEFLGQLANPAPHIAAADALVLPSRFEGLPNAVLEAMALGTPVIATRSGGTVELERDEPTIWWAAPNDPSELAAAIRQFAANRDAATDRVNAAKRLVETYHHPQLAVDAIERLLL